VDIKKLIRNDIRYRIALALDITDPEKLKDILSMFRDRIRIIKLGVSTLYSFGLDIIDKCKDLGYIVFADVKLNDIPMQVIKAANAIFSHGAGMVTAHCLGGAEMLKGVVKASKDSTDEITLMKPFVLGVTVLTSLDDDDLKRLGFRYGTLQSAVNLASIAVECKLDGVVCAAEELIQIRSIIGPDMITVVPGIRWNDEKKDDQKRIIGPREAIRKSADILVIGRPILNSESPLNSLEDLFNEINDLI